VAALVVIGLLFASALVIPLVVFGGGQTVAEQTTVLTTTAPPTTTLEQPTTTTATQPNASAKAPLRIALGKNESMHRGDRGSAVVKLQKALAALGFAAGEPDGVFGQVTQAAVIDFQQSNNLDPDGIVGADTASLLNTALAKKGVTG
jgi:peptidoglycan hydrolase-like protein with peptidoglycan-binding domain